MKNPKPVKTFVIRNKITKEIFRAKSGKTSWKAPHHAKAAFALSLTGVTSLAEYGLEELSFLWQQGEKHKYDSLYFSEQNIYEVVELKSETEEAFGKALLLLKEVFERERSVSWSLADKIEKFLIENSIEINYED